MIVTRGVAGLMLTADLQNGRAYAGSDAMRFAKRLFVQVLARSSMAAALAKPARTATATATGALGYIFERMALCFWRWVAENG